MRDKHGHWGSFFPNSMIYTNSYDPTVDRTFHRLSRNNRSVVGLHISVVHSDFISDSVFQPNSSFSASESEYSVDTIVDNNQTLKELATPDVVYQPWYI